jgi:hypothetical protein
MPQAKTILFWLAPKNTAALKAVEDQANSAHVSTITEVEKGFVISSTKCFSRTPGCLMTIGRAGDIKISGSLISRVHVEISLNASTKEILLRDTSNLQKTKAHLCSMSNLFCFPSTGARQVVLRPDEIMRIGVGGENSCLYDFEVVWPPQDAQLCQEADQFKEEFLARPRSLGLAATEQTATPGSRYETRIQTPGQGPIWIHRRLGPPIGVGTYGEVSKTVNMHAGDYYAVKTIRPSEPLANDTAWRRHVLEEANTLQKLYHVSYPPHLS